MSFWGIEVKPGKPYPYHSDDVQGKLRVTQATLGLGSSEERCILQCSVGHKSPIFLCSLLPGKAESCTLNLEFSDELVAFSVIGPRSIHLCGYFDSEKGDHLRDEYEYDSGETIADTESDESSEYDYDDEYDDDDDDFIDDDNDLQIYTSSPIPSDGVVIEGITEDDQPEKENGKSKRLKKKKKKKKNQSSDQEDQNNSQGQIVLKRDAGISVLESEDEDGFPISSSSKKTVTVQELLAEINEQKEKETTQETKKKIAREDNDDTAGKKRKVKSIDQDGQPESKTKKKKKKNKQREQGAEEKIDEMDDMKENNNASRDDIKSEEDSGTATKEQAVSAVGGEAKYLLDSEDKQSTTKSSQARTFSNGLVIEELSMGKPDGKRASPGSQVSVRYVGKLKKNDKIFDSNVGRAPFKFRLGVGQVIKGWDVGVNGMRVGDKRRLTIPPSMGYGEQGAGGKIPPNSWLVFDVELVNVR
ncbi:hypothetical protein SADUNF_Sadunf15G0110400 [Salix dunnii]|uniref:FK506-binding protein n=1 Tax=Salix dunnii TaxID=1413687 RepID=A0A835JGV7_9ROSI|nr:hypothetical protein SADUNF_Sadunf15G0110400 [Salix dunnii]